MSACFGNSTLAEAARKVQLEFQSRRLGPACQLSHFCENLQSMVANLAFSPIVLRWGSPENPVPLSPNPGAPPRLGSHESAMKKAIAALSLAAGCGAGLVCSAQAQTFEVNREALVLRSEPSERGGPATVLGVLRRGDRVSAGHDRWMRVAVESGSQRGKVGYVARRGLEESNWTQESAYLNRVSSGNSYHVSGVAQFATLRNAMSTAAAPVERVPRGDFVVSLSSPPGSGWHYVQVVGTGAKGWIPSRYLAPN